ncbi:site-specific integrase [Paenibacillus senegalimassiliensis]|uniref:site-specific integrase n=1 Tax=Paenibacillus senegalimassiliensis TaxID=1737426 RepID=UPI00073EFF5E|nr:site-specific integrase [Paenibacillus senegalimassiliensis]
MGWTEHLGGKKYKLVERDPSKASRPKRSVSVEMPQEIYNSKSEKKKESWLAVELDKWSTSVFEGNYQDRQKNHKLANRKTFNDFKDTWLKVYARPNMSGKTVRNTISIIDSRLTPEFGDMWISDITTLQLAEWFSGLKNLKNNSPLATNSKLNIYKVALGIFEKAHDWGVITSNPMAGVDRPSANKQEKKKMRGVKQNYTREEVARLLLAMYEMPERWRLYFTGVMLGGFRRGEWLAVQWPDLDYEHSAVYIENQITVNDEGKKVEAEVKTVESEDWVPLPRWYMEELRRFHLQWRKEKLLCKKWLGDPGKEYIFHSGDGVIYYPSTPTNTWNKFLKKHGLTHVKLHGLRHTAATLLREHGADQRSIQKFLRHSKLETTDRYTHEREMVNRSLIDPLENLNPKAQNFAP